jgi:hypothetical protein
MQFGAERTKLRSFWHNFLSRPTNRDTKEKHPIVGGMDLDTLDTVIPITVHADAGPFTKTSACYCVSFSSLVGAGEAKLTTFVCASYVQNSGSPTDYLWWGHLFDELLALGSGVVNGTEVARDSNGTLWRGAFLFCKSDEDVRSNDFGLTHFSGRDEVCPECLANRTTRPFTDMREDANWTPGEEMALVARCREPPHPLVESEFFCHRHFFPIDTMHLLGCKGVTPMTFGSGLLHLLRVARLGANREERLEAIKARRVSFYAARPGIHKLPKILLTSCTRDGWGNLGGKAYKATKVRTTAPFFKKLVDHYCTSADPRDTNLRTVVTALDNLYDDL